MKLNVLCIGDIVGRPGRRIIAETLKALDVPRSVLMSLPVVGSEPGETPNDDEAAPPADDPASRRETEQDCRE